MSAASQAAVSGPYINPFPPGTVAGRIDQGQDFTLKPGDPLLAPGRVKIRGIIPNWYKGQPLVWFQFLDGPLKGHFQYYAEQITGIAKPDSIVEKGQPVAFYAKSGTALEAGFATSTGRVLTPYNASDYEKATPGGRAYASWLAGVGKGTASGQLGGHGGPLYDLTHFVTDPNVPDPITAAAEAGVKFVAGQAWDWFKAHALVGMMKAVFVIAGIVLAAYGLATMFGQQDKLKGAAKGIASRAALAAAV